MTISLAIDTATSRTIVGVIEDGKVLFEAFHEGATEHGFAITELVMKALEICPKPDQVVVGMGPGPFTGLRVGITFAHTFALAREIPVIGVCSLDAIKVQESDYTVAIDARRKEIYWAKYLNGVRTIGPSVAKPEALTEYSEPKFGFGFTSELSPHPKDLLKISEERKNHLIEPMYLRNPDAVPTIDRK